MLKNLFKQGVRKALAHPRIRWIAEQELSAGLHLDPAVYASRRWEELEPVFTTCRRKLFADPDWRYGPARVRIVAEETCRKWISCSGGLEGQVYMDMGAGHHPFSTSAVMFLNGADQTCSLDITEAPAQRAAEALYDLLTDCMLRPEQWHWSDISRSAFMERLGRFDLSALQQGDLKAGLAEAPLKYIVADINKADLGGIQADFLSTRAVLEHFLEIEEAVKNLYQLMRPGGMAYHLIDLVDHRGYHFPDRFHYWSFLAEPEGYRDKDCNMLRCSEFRTLFEQVGFEVIECVPDRARAMPEGFAEKVQGRFKEMTQEELGITSVRFLLKRPENA